MKFGSRYLAFVALVVGIGSVSAAQSPTKAVQKEGQIGQNDYPVSSMARLEEGLVIVSFTIQASGDVANCTIDSSSGFPELDNHTCKLISERFKYAPARNGKGQPIAEQKSQRVQWRIPRPPSLPELKSFTNETVMTVAPSGVVTSCKARQDGVDVSGSEKDKMCQMAFKFGFKPLGDGRTRKVILTNVATIEAIE